MLTTRFLWLVIAAGVLFVVIGVAMYWGVVSNQNPFDDGVGARDTFFDDLVRFLSPAFVQAGVLGIVGALLAWALAGSTGPATPAPPRERP